MKVLPPREFRELASSKMGDTSLLGFINPATFEATVPRGTSVGVKLHELGHEKFSHLLKSFQVYGRGRKDFGGIKETREKEVDDEIEAEMYSFRLRGKEITPKVGLQALVNLVNRGFRPNIALGLVIGRLKRFGVITSWKDRVELVKVLGRMYGNPVEGYENL